VVLPLQLRPSSGRDLPREIDARPPSVTVMISPEGLTAFAADGAVALGPLAGAAAKLAELRRAFPDETQVAVAIDPTATYRDLVAVARAARAAFRRVSLVAVPRRVPGEGFAARLRRRTAARLSVRGADGARAESVLRGCFMEALDRDPATSAEATLSPGKPTVVDGVTDPALRECLARRAPALGAAGPLTVGIVR
jgi:hypothetical protein